MELNFITFILISIKWLIILKSHYPHFKKISIDNGAQCLAFEELFLIKFKTRFNGCHSRVNRGIRLNPVDICHLILLSASFSCENSAQQKDKMCFAASKSRLYQTKMVRVLRRAWKSEGNVGERRNKQQQRLYEAMRPASFGCTGGADVHGSAASQPLRIN